MTLSFAPAGEVRILRVLSRLNVGGPSLHAILLSADLRKRGYSTRLVVGREGPREGNLLEVAAERGVACVQIEGLGRQIRPLSDVRALWSLYRLLKAYRPHILHSHAAKAGVLGRLAARLAGVPVIVHTYHGHVLSGYFGRLPSAVFRRIETALAWRSTVLVAVSAAVKRDLVTFGIAPEERIRVIPLGLELQPVAGKLPRGSLRLEAGFTDAAPVVGIVGRLVPIKDVETFLRAAALLRTRFPEARFSVVGDGHERAALERHAEQLGLTEAVHFHGWRRDMAAVYGDLDVVVNCSRNEGTPVVLIEAMAAERPVVATAVGGTVDLLGGGSRGRLVPAGDPALLAEGIQEALEGSEDVRRRCLSAREYVLRLHCGGRLLDDMDALYRELLSAGGVAS